MSGRSGAVAATLMLAAGWASLAAAGEEAAFRVEEASLDLGRVISGRTAYATYTFHNDGPAPVRILQVKPSCGCTVADYDRVIPPGGSGELRASVSTMPQQSGAFSKSIHVATDAEGARRLLLRFTVHIEQPIIGMPRLRMVVRGLEGEALTGGMLLRRTDGAPLQIYDANTGHAGLVARATSIESPGRRGGFDATAGDVWIELSGSSELEVGVITGNLRLQTNHPELDLLEVPYTVRVQSLVEVRPDVVRLWPSDGGRWSGGQVIVGLRRRDGGDLRVAEVSVSHPDLFTARADPASQNGYQRLRVALADGLTDRDLAASTDGTITVETSDAALPEVRIPVIVAPSEALTRRAPRPGR